MTKLFNEGYCFASQGKLWNHQSAVDELGEVVARHGVCLTAEDVNERGTIRIVNRTNGPRLEPRSTQFRL